MADAVGATPGVTLADVHADPDHHRAVFTFLGAPAAVAAAARALADVVLAEIDMREHRGIHPRIGALDVLPFVPLVGVTMPEIVALALETGRVLAERHALPVYYYGEAARRPERRTLRELRHGEYEGLVARLSTDDGRPDDGPARFDARRGAMLDRARGPDRQRRAAGGAGPRSAAGQPRTCASVDEPARSSRLADPRRLRPRR